MATVNRKDLLQAMKSVMPGIDRAGFKENTDSFLFHEGILTTCNTIVSVSTKLDVGGLNFAVRAQEIYALVSKSSAEEAEISIDGGKLRYKCGGLRSSIVLSDPAPLVKVVKAVSVGEFKPLPENFGEAVLASRLSHYSEGRYKGIAVADDNGKSVMLSFDGDAFAMYTLSSPMDSLFVDDGLVAQSLALGTAREYSIDRSWLTLRYDSGAEFSCKVNNVLDYPAEAILRLVGTVGSAEGTTFKLPQGFDAAVERVSVMAFDKRENGLLSNNVRLTLSGDGVTVYAEKASRGEAEETVPWGEGMESVSDSTFFVSAQFVVDAVRKGGVFKMVKPNPNGRKVVLIMNVGDLSYYVNCVSNA